jgi:glucosamine-6-phosphate deaminase
MEVVIQPDAAAVAVFGADIIDRLVSTDARCGARLGHRSSPLALYDELIRRCLSSKLSFEQATAFLLDEYIGLPPGHPASYRVFIEQHFTGQDRHRHVARPRARWCGRRHRRRVR